MDKIKCIRSENGTIIPIHNIAVISAEDASHYIWTNSDCDSNNCGHKLSDRTYNILLEELDIIDGQGFKD